MNVGKNNLFVSPKLTPKNILTYSVRKSLLDAITIGSERFHGIVLDIGCGIMPYRQLVMKNTNVSKYIGMDFTSEYHKEVIPDLLWDGITIPLEKNSMDCILATEFFEHYHDTSSILNEIFRTLKPQGLLFATVPFIWCLHEVPFDEYRFTPFSIEKKLKKAGFINIEIYPLGGYDYALAQLLGLWVIHRPMNRFLRRLLIYILFPIYAILIKIDKKPTTFTNNTMYSGLYFFAQKP